MTFLVDTGAGLLEIVADCRDDAEAICTASGWRLVEGCR